MRSLRALFLAFVILALPLVTGCGAGVDTSPAVGDPATLDNDSTSGMTEAEKEEFAKGEAAP